MSASHARRELERQSHVPALAPPRATAAGPTEVAVDAATAKKYDLSVGETIKILFQGPPQEFTISGTLGFGEADNLAGATLAAFDVATAQKVLDKAGEFDQIDVVAADGTSVPDLRSSIQSVLPKGIEAVKASDVADEQARQLQEALGFFRTALLVFAFIALFVGAFIIFNTFSIIVAQRTGEMALLRAIGASRRQVMTSVVVEAFVTGLIASALGLLAGVGIALALKGLLSAFGIDLPSTSLQLEPRTIVVAFVVGTVVTVVSSILPARRASRVAPVQALRESADSASGSLRRRLIIGLILTAAGVAALLYGLFGNQSNAGPLIGLGAAVTFVGIAVLLPLGTRPLAGAIGAPIRRLGVQGKLGRENAMRNPRRTASTASALMIGLGLVAMVTVLASSLKASLNLTIEKSLKADLVLTTSSQTPFSPDVADRVREVDGVGAVSQFRQGGFRVKDRRFVPGRPRDDRGRGVAGTVPGSGLGPPGRQDRGPRRSDGRRGLEGRRHHPHRVRHRREGAARDRGHVLGEQLGRHELRRLARHVRSVLPAAARRVREVKLAPGADATAVTTSVEAATKEFGNIEVQDQTEELIDEPRLLLAEGRLILDLDVAELLRRRFDGCRHGRGIGPRRSSLTITNASSCCWKY